MKVKFLMFISLVTLLLLSGCYKNDEHTFRNGSFVYEGDPVQFTEDFTIDHLTLTFNKISKDEYESQNGKNVLKNHVNDDMYAVTLALKYSGEEEAKKYDFEYVKKQAGIPDSYIINIDLTNEVVGIEGHLNLRFIFEGPVKRGLKKGTPVDEVWHVKIMDYDIKVNEENQEIIEFPQQLKFVE